MDLPPTIERKEVLSVPIVVYNHLNKDITAEVTLHNPEQKFLFADAIGQLNATKSE